MWQLYMNSCTYLHLFVFGLNFTYKRTLTWGILKYQRCGIKYWFSKDINSIIILKSIHDVFFSYMLSGFDLICDWISLERLNFPNTLQWKHPDSIYFGVTREKFIEFLQFIKCSPYCIFLGSVRRWVWKIDCKVLKSCWRDGKS